MATITLGTTGLAATGLGAATAGAALAGAAVLGVAAAAALASRGRRRGRGHRRGRSLQQESEAIERVMELVRQEDASRCGMRLACDLGATPRHLLQGEAAAILDLIGPGVVPGEGVLPPGASGEYKAARGLGGAGGDCALAFPTCPLDGTQLMQVVAQYLP